MTAAPQCFRVMSEVRVNEELQRQARLGRRGTGPYSALVAYASHHYECETCCKEDWYTPGSPRILSEPQGADGEVRVRTTGVDENGDTIFRTVYYSRSPDPKALCKTGCRLFKEWEKAVIKDIGG